MRLAIVLASSGLQAGEPPSEEQLRPTSLPSLDQRIRDAELIVRVSVESKHGVIVYRILETFKGTYHWWDYGDQYKGFFTDYLSARESRSKHNEEIWFLSHSETLFGPDKRQTDPDSISFYRTKFYRDQLRLPIQAGIINLPTMERPYRHQVLEKKAYKRDEFISQIRTLAKSPN